MQFYISLYEFNGTLVPERFNLLWSEGVFLMNRASVNSKFNLYALADFFVEVEYVSDENKIRGMRSFKSTKPLDEYLELISI